MGEAFISRTLKGESVNLVQSTGNSSTDVMSQKVCTDNFLPKSRSHSASNVTSGSLPVSRGGAGTSSSISGNILIGNGTSAVISTSAPLVSKGGTGNSSLTSGNILLENETNAISPTPILVQSKGGT